MSGAQAGAPSRLTPWGAQRPGLVVLGPPRGPQAPTQRGSFPRALSVSEAGSLSPAPSITTAFPLCCPLLHPAKDTSGGLSAQCPGRGSQSLPEAACGPLCWPAPRPHLLRPAARGTWVGPVYPEFLEPPVLLSRTLCPQAYHVPGMGGCSEAHPTDGPSCLGAHGGGVLGQ